MTPAGALDGIRVMEVGTLISGPFAGRLVTLGGRCYAGGAHVRIRPVGAPEPPSWIG